MIHTISRVLGRLRKSSSAAALDRATSGVVSRLEELEGRRLFAATVNISDSTGASDDKTIALANTAMGQISATQTFHIENIGTSAMNVTNFTKAGAQANDFVVSVTDNLNQAVNATSFTVPANTFYTVTVRYRPTQVGAEAATVTFDTSAANGPNETLAMSSIGLAQTSFAPILVVNDSVAPGFDQSIALADTQVGFNSATETFSLTNVGNANLLVTNFAKTGANANDFIVTVTDAAANTVTNPGFIIGPGQTFTVTVKFRPTVTGPESASISFNTTDINAHNVSLGLSGVGTAPAVPDPVIVISDTVDPADDKTVNFDDTAIGNTSLQSFFAIENQGGSALHLTAITVNGAKAADFPITLYTEAGAVIAGNAMTIPIGAKYFIGVAFHPTVVGAETATITFNTDDPTDPADTLTANGNGVTSAKPFTPSNVQATALSYDQIQVTWTDNSSNEAYFKILRASTSGGVYTQVGTVNVNLTTFTDKLLTPNTTYFYKVAAVNATGSSLPSAIAASATTLAAPVDGIGNTFATATNVGKLNGRVTYSNFVGNPDKNDFYKFTFNVAGQLRAFLTANTADLDIYLYQVQKNNTNKLIARSENPGDADELILKNIQAGTYFLKVTQGTANNDSNYTLQLTANYAGTSRATARVLRDVSERRVYKDFVGANDLSDYFRFSLVGGTAVSLDLYGLAENADINLINKAGKVIKYSHNAGTTSESLRLAIKPGIYYIRVYVPRFTLNTNYTLAIDTVQGPPGSV